jgi:small nuclear ribonucleoprotein (snRNP)-like protein
MTYDTTRQALTSPLRAALKREQEQWSLWITSVKTARGRLLAGSSQAMNIVIQRVRENPEADEKLVLDQFFLGGTRAARAGQAPHVEETAKQVETGVGRAYLAAWAEGWLTAAEEQLTELQDQMGVAKAEPGSASEASASRATERRTRSERQKLPRQSALVL